MNQLQLHGVTYGVHGVPQSEVPLGEGLLDRVLPEQHQEGHGKYRTERKLELRQKTCWLFKRKVTQAMKSSGNRPMQGTVEVDEAVVDGQEETVRGWANKKKRLVVFAIERKGKGVNRMHGKLIPSAHAKNLGGFMKQNLDAKANVRTVGWTGYSPLKKQFNNLQQEKAQPKGKNFKEMHRIIMGFKGWLRGVYHKASHLQAYADEYSLRVPRRTSLRRYRRSAPTLRAHASRSAILRCPSVGYFGSVSALRRALSGRTIVTRAIRSMFFEVPLRFNRRFMKEGVFENLHQRMMRTEPCP